MESRTFTYLLLSSLAAISCSASHFDADMMYEDTFAVIRGEVTDIKGGPIEHIEVTFEIEDSHKTAYTSSDGSYMIQLTWEEAGDASSIGITLNDTDGDKNGGEFKSLSDNILLYDEHNGRGPVIINRDFIMELK